MASFTIEPGSSNLFIPKNGEVTVRNAGQYACYYDREGTGFDNVLQPGQGLMVRTPTVFVTMANAKGSATIDVL